MKKILLALCCTVLAGSSLLAQDHTELDALVGRFQQLYNGQQFDSIPGLLSFRLQGLITPEKAKEAMGGLYKQFGALKSFQFQKSEDALSYYHITFASQSMQMLTSLSPEHRLDALRFIPEKQKQTDANATEVTLKIATGTLHGTLTLPEGKAKVPVVLLIAGSGPTDRDGNNSMGLKTNTYRMLADSLRRAGIATLRYDKRGVGESAGTLKDESTMTFDSIVSDAVGFIKLLAADTRFSGVIVAGHSEGSLVGMIAAQRTDVKKYISIAGAGESADKILMTQLSAQSPESAEKARIIMDSLKAGLPVLDIPAGLVALFRPSIQPYMRSWLTLDPTKEIRKLKIPILLIQGRNDLQVSAGDAENLKAAAPKAQLELIAQMNHILKDASEDKRENYGTYMKPELPLTPELSRAMIAFIKAK